MLRLFPAILLLLILPAPAAAVVEISLPGQPTARIDEVYLRDGVAYLAADEVLAVLGLSGNWDSVAHVYRIRTPRGTARISPGSQYLRFGERFVPLAHPPRFIDGRLRVAEDFVASQLPGVLGLSLQYRNLDPSPVVEDAGDTPLDKLFAFLLRKKKPTGSASLRAVALDPGHGGQDPGAIGPDGAKEKDVTLAVAKKLEKQLKMQLGIPVYLSRDADYALERHQRLEPAARPDVDALVVLHAQGAFGPDPRGATFFVRPQQVFAEGDRPVGEGESRRLARLLGESFEAAGLTVAGTAEAPLLPLGQGDLPTVLVELGYLTNPDDSALLQQSAGQERLAEALLQGLKHFAEDDKEVHR